MDISLYFIITPKTNEEVIKIYFFFIFVIVIIIGLVNLSDIENKIKAQLAFRSCSKVAIVTLTIVFDCFRKLIDSLFASSTNLKYDYLHQAIRSIEISHWMRFSKIKRFTIISMRLLKSRQFLFFIGHIF